MNFKIENRHEFSILNIDLPAQEKIFVEAGAMVAMSTNIKMKTLFKGGFRRFLSKESLFLSEFKSEKINGELSLAPGVVGDIGHCSLNGEKLYLSSSSYMAHTEGVSYSTKFQKLSQGILSGAGWFLIEMSGKGDVWFNSYGALVEAEVDQEFLLDNGHIVAFTEGLDYEIVRLGGYKSLFFSGEGFVCRFRGKGRVYFQTKKPASLINWANKYRPVKANNN